jgi:hypothetical protein
LTGNGNAARFVESLALADLIRAVNDWPVFAGLKQRPPLSDWRTWLMLGGRGAGKTRAGAQWLSGLVTRDRHYAGDAAGRVAIIGETYSDARAVMIEGESGLLAVSAPGRRPQWNSAKRELVWPDGTIGQVFSAADPEGLRGSQFGAAWCDDLRCRDFHRDDRHHSRYRRPVADRRRDGADNRGRRRAAGNPWTAYRDRGDRVMNWLAIAAALTGVARALAAIAARWLDDRRLAALRNLHAKARAHDLLAKAVAARNRTADSAGGLRDGPAPADRYRRE